MMKRKRIYRFWVAFEDIVSTIFLFSGVCVIFYGVIMRYLFNSPESWVEELSTYLVIWGILFGFSVALRNSRHIKVELFYDKMPSNIKKIMDFIVNCLGILFCLFLIYYGSILVIDSYNSGITSLNMGFPLWITYLILPISCLMFVFRFIKETIDLLK